MDETWHKSTWCEGGQCVRARRVDDDVQVKDSAELVVSFSVAAWRAFVEGVRDGEFDREP